MSMSMCALKLCYLLYFLFISAGLGHHIKKKIKIKNSTIAEQKQEEGKEESREAEINPTSPLFSYKDIHPKKKKKGAGVVVEGFECVSMSRLNKNLQAIISASAPCQSQRLKFSQMRGITWHRRDPNPPALPTRCHIPM